MDSHVHGNDKEGRMPSAPTGSHAFPVVKDFKERSAGQPGKVDTFLFPGETTDEGCGRTMERNQ